MLQIAVGDEGYLVGGSTWYDNGSKGTDWGLMLKNVNIDFGTVHICAAHTLPWQPAAMSPARINSFIGKAIARRLCPFLNFVAFRRLQPLFGTM